jgi:hypothetical protein
MYCCSNCFHDKYLKEHIHTMSRESGNCSFCGSLNVQVIKPEKLYDLFVPVFELYEEKRLGAMLHSLLKRDWNIFNLREKSHIYILISMIAGDEISETTKYKPIFRQDESKREAWNSFKEELKHYNRFKPKSIPKDDDLGFLFKYIGIKVKRDDTLYFRARIDHGKILTEKEMKKPPIENSTTNGRANPIGISYLYLATDEKTAIAEIRPYKEETVTIAEYSCNHDLNLADLRQPHKIISPFMVDNADELPIIYQNLAYLFDLSVELSKPINPNDANLEYLPSQYLCEFIKQMSYDGIIYGSSLSTGSNFVIFNDSKFVITNLYQSKITDFKIKFKKHNN